MDRSKFLRIQPTIIDMSTPNGTPGVPPPESTSSGFNPSMAIIIVVLIGACLVVAIFSVYIRKCTQGDDTNNRRVSRSPSVHFFERPGEGLDRAIIDSLPVVNFSVVKTLKAGKEDLECAVCLERFEAEESLRLLPKCSHVFHTECIDEWFTSHSTCPMCRTSLKVTVEEVNAGVPAVGEVSRRILEAQEELFGSSRMAGSVLDENEVFEGSSREVGRDLERNSARMALFRNSDSLRQAARGVEVRERLASLSARYPAASSSSSSADVFKDSQRTSSLSCVSLPRTGSSNARDAEKLFKYGSQRYGAAGSASLGRLNEQDQSIPGAAAVAREGASSSSNHWTALELDASNAKPTPTDDAVRKQHTPPMLGKPRSGPLAGKQGNGQRKAGSVTVKSERGSLRGLRGSFSALHRSVSEGGSQFFATEPLVTEATAATAADLHVNSSSGTLAQRTMQWLSGGNKHPRSSSARVSLEQRHADALQHVVTE